MNAVSTTHYTAPALFEGQEGTEGGDEVSISLPGGVQMIFCWCPKPEQPFQIGSRADEPDRDIYETPTWVILSHGFWLAKHPCSQAQWQALGMENHSQFSGDLGSRVENVSWDDSKSFCQKANHKSQDIKALLPIGWRMVMPTQAQWQYACRAGRGIDLPFGIGDGRGINGQIANFAANSPYSSFEWQYREQALPAGSFPPNTWGLHDMHGQLWEWCTNWNAPNPPTSSEQPLKDYQGATNSGFRMRNGGGWRSLGRNCRAASSRGLASDYRAMDVGFRPTLIPETQSLMAGWE